MDKKLLGYFCDELKRPLELISGDISEIRMRINRPLSLICHNKAFYLTQNGEMLSSVRSDCIIISTDIINKTFEAICRYSIHSYQKDICEGFITLDGGHRVGICGTAVIKDGVIINIKNISGLNFRAAHQVKGCAEEICNMAYSSGIKNVIIAGGPASGKTTVLRDMCRILGQRYKVSLIDERGEIAACSGGIPQNDIGIGTDVLNGYPKAKGIETAVRVMSPDIIICDEAGGREDITAFDYAAVSGVNLAVSVHASKMEDIREKIPFYKKFDYIFFLSSPSCPGIIRETVMVNRYG